jgi:hypothetical protein
MQQRPYCWWSMATPPHLDDPSRARKWPAAIATTLAAWLVAFGVVTALLTAFGDELASLPLALRALVISGVLVALMVNLVMPVLNVAVARWVRGGPRAPVAGSARPGTSAVPEQPRLETMRSETVRSDLQSAARLPRASATSYMGDDFRRSCRSA